jgi:F0F1-type ATP synthase assembly protein I
MAATFALFVLLGLFIDGRTGTRPLFTVVFALLAVIGLGARAYYTYKDQIERDEEGKPWRQKNP